jgi:hypothetical protein
MCSNDPDGLVRLDEALRSMAATSSADPTAVAAAPERVLALLEARARLDGLLMAEIVGLDASGVSVEDGYASAAAWLRGRARLGRRDASALVHQARVLRDLVATSQALRDGQISREHAGQIVKAKQASLLTTGEFAAYEEVLVELATEASPDEVKAAVQHLTDAEAPDRDKQLLAALADRSFELRPIGDLVKVDAVVDKVTAAALIAGIDSLSRRTPSDDRSWQVRRADAFSHLIMLGLESGQLPQHGRVKPHLAVTITLDQLTGIAGTGPLLARFGRIPLSSAQRLACDAALTRLITDPAGEVLDVGRSSRFTTTAQSTAIAAMYDRCGYPNCETAVTGCDIHHVRWWSNGGTTDRANLVPLCKHHHLFVHEYGYTIHNTTDADGLLINGPRRWEFRSPRGAPIPDHRRALRDHMSQLALIPDQHELALSRLAAPGRWE